MSLNLHRVADGLESDWQGKSYDMMNHWQQRAYDTNGIDTPGNRITLARILLGGASLLAVKTGHKKIGLIGLAITLGADWLDGKVADMTETKMRRNGKFDAIADMAMRAGMVYVMSSEDMMDKTYAKRLALLNIGIAGTTVANGLLGHEPHSSALGKAKTVVEGMSVMTAGINSVTQNPDSFMRQFENGINSVALAGNAAAELGYLHELFSPRTHPETE